MNVRPAHKPAVRLSPVGVLGVAGAGTVFGVRKLAPTTIPMVLSKCPAHTPMNRSSNRLVLILVPATILNDDFSSSLLNFF
jgi:hypothetical protein